ncbi:hypothetical protein LDENG_00246860, partial [Lucifuga dentata]
VIYLTSLLSPKVFRPLQFLHILLCCRFNFKWIKLPFLPINLHPITHDDKVMLLEIFANLLKIKLKFFLNSGLCRPPL